MTGKQERDEFRARLLRGMLTGEKEPNQSLLTYSNITYHMGDTGWSHLVRVLFEGTNVYLEYSERCRIVLDELNKKYPEG